MHISDGILSVPVVAAGSGVTLIGTAYGLWKLKYDEIPRAAFLSSVFFVASLISVPIGITKAHLILNGLVGILLGPVSFPVILTGLTLQSLLFGWGGITALGVNTMNMALPALLCGVIFRHLLKPASKDWTIFSCGFASGASSIVLSALITGLGLYLSGPQYQGAALFILGAHLPVMLIEGIVTGFILVFLMKVRPSIFENEKETCHES